MRYEVTHGREVYHVTVKELVPDVFDVELGDAEAVRVDARRTAQTNYSILIGTRQYEASVDERPGGVLDVHVGMSAFDLLVVDERRRLLTDGTAHAPTGKQRLKAQMPGKIVKLLVRVGQEVEAEQGLLVIEAMKMENELRSPVEGIVTEIAVAEGDAVETDALLVVVEPEEEEVGAP